MTAATIRLHDRNSDFAWTDHSGPFRFVTEEQARRYDNDGFFVVEDAFSPDEMERVVAEIDPLEHRGEEELRKLKNGTYLIARADEITFTTHLVQRSPNLRAFTRSPLFAALCADLIGPDVRLYWDQAVYKKPGTEAPFPWHQDNGYAFVLPQHYLTCWVALTDATEENGCPWVVPGVHRMGTLAHATSDIGFVCMQDPENALAVPVKAGSIVVFSSLTPHSTGPNLSDSVRKAYIVQFAPDGAAVVESDGTRTLAQDEQRQFVVVKGGQAIA